MSAASISARPSVVTGENIERIAAELNLSPGQFVIAAAEAIITMADSPEPIEPKIVRAVRVLRQHNATFTHAERRLSASDALVLHVAAGAVDGQKSDGAPQSQDGAGSGKPQRRKAKTRAAQGTAKTDGQ